MINKNRAFTLFELLVSISIIGILVAVASTAYGSTQRKARDSRRMEDMNAIQKAAEIYYSTHSYNYPPAEADFVSSGVLQQWPVDPKGSGTSTPYVYNVGGTYCACAAVENTATGNSSDDACSFAASGDYYCVRSQQ